MPKGIYERTKENIEKIKKLRLGKEPWNKGKTNIYSEGTRKRMGLVNIGNKRHFGFRNTEESRRKMSESHKGQFLKDKNPNWKGGKSFEPYTTDWTETLKRAIRERDSYICQLCSQYGNYVHHINYDKKDCSIENLVTLCVSCHGKTGINRDYWINHFHTSSN